MKLILIHLCEEGSTFFFAEICSCHCVNCSRVCLKVDEEHNEIIYDRKTK